MAIRIEHGGIREYAALGTLAGQATAAREAVARQDVMTRQTRQIQAQRASQERAFAHQRERDEFDAYMNNLKYQSAQAWDLEKMEMRSRHDFDMVEARREATFRNQLDKEQRQEREVEMKLKAIDDTDWLSDEEKRTARAKIEYGITLRQPTPLKPGEELRTLEADYGYYLGITERYKRNVDTKPGWGKEMGTGVLDKKGKVIGPASPQQLVELEHAERKLEELSQHFRPRADVVEPTAVRTGQLLGREPAISGLPAIDRGPAISPTMPQPAQADINNLLMALPDVDKASQAQLVDIIRRGNPTEIQEALKLLETEESPVEPPKTEKRKRGRWFAFPGGPPL